MRCNEFDAHIDEMLSGVLHPDANQHMRQCERCTSHFHARAMVQSGLRALATATGPSRTTDRAVMDSYRRLQQRRSAVRSPQSASVSAASTVRMFTFPSRNLAPVWTSRTWWSGAAAAAVVFAVLGSGIHLWKGASAVGEPTVATAPSSPTGQPIAAATLAVLPTATGVATRLPAQRSEKGTSLFAALRSKARATLAPAAVSSEPAEPTLSAKTVSVHPRIAYGDGSNNYDSMPVTQLEPNVAPVIRLASTGSMNNNVAQSASSTWPGYSNLMYCDPVTCSGPMQVVHIKVPVSQVRPNLGQTVGNAFVNAEVVVGPDGVARAIRVAN